MPKILKSGVKHTSYVGATGDCRACGCSFQLVEGDDATACTDRSVFGGPTLVYWEAYCPECGAVVRCSHGAPVKAPEWPQTPPVWWGTPPGWTPPVQTLPVPPMDLTPRVWCSAGRQQ
jgi:hypothetical protein